MSIILDGSTGVTADSFTGSGAPLTNMLYLGVGQTWQSVTRAVGTTYQNTTGKPIMVCVNAASSDNAGLMQTSTDGSTWLTLGDFFNYTTYSIVIPPNHYYRVSGTVTQLTWTELR